MWGTGEGGREEYTWIVMQNTKNVHDIPEAEFLDAIGTKVLKVSSFHSQSTPPREWRRFETVCYVNIVYGNLKSSWELSRLCQETLTKLCVHEFVFMNHADQFFYKFLKIWNYEIISCIFTKWTKIFVYVILKTMNKAFSKTWTKIEHSLLSYNCVLKTKRSKIPRSLLHHTLLVHLHKQIEHSLKYVPQLETSWICLDYGK